MRIIGTALILAGLVAPCSAAEITYLTCNLPATSKDEVAVRYDVTLDEARGVVSWVANKRTASQAKALFTRDTVTWTDPDVDPTLIHMSYTISRIDLSFTLDLAVGADRKMSEHKAGKCELDDRPRKF